MLTFADIVDEWGVSKARVHQVIEMAEREGIVTVIRKQRPRCNYLSRSDYRKLLSWRKKLPQRQREQQQRLARGSVKD